MAGEEMSMEEHERDGGGPVDRQTIIQVAPAVYECRKVQLDLG